MEGSPVSSHKLRFGVFEVDLEDEELRRSGIRQKLGPQAFHLLRAMLERPGQLVTHEELRQRLWPDTAFIDHQLGLKKCVNRIREVLGDSADHPCYIETVPRRGYRFVAPVERVIEAEIPTKVIATDEIKVPEAATRPASPSAASSPAYRPLLRSLPIAILVLITAWLLWRNNKDKPGVHAERQAEPIVLPLISLPGEQSMPAFSPDGSRVAFAWRAPDPTKSGIYAAVIGAQSLLRLTQNSGDYSPAWAPDGRQVAFLRDEDDRFLIGIVPALGGVEQTIYTGRRTPLTYPTEDAGLSFSSDGKLLAFSEWNAANQNAAIKLLSLQDSTPRFVTFPPAGFRDHRPAFSRTADKLIFVRSTGPNAIDDLFVIPKEGGAPQQLTFDNKQIFGPPAWMPGGEEIVFSSNRAGLDVIWRIPVSGGVARRVPGAGPIAWYPSVSPSGGALAFQHVDEEENLWGLELKDPTHSRGKASILVSSAKTYNLLPQFSPDGRKVAFQTGRSGYAEIWICDRDGSNLVQLTTLQGFAGSPRWSPDGRYLAFDYRPRQHSEIFVVEVGSVHPRSVAAFPDADNIIPSWSRDGKCIYFASNHGKTFQIWKTAVNQGAAAPIAPVQVTKSGGYVAFESADGKQLFYTKSNAPGIWATPVDERRERLLWRGPGPDYWSNWAVTRDGIYFMAPQADSRPQIQFLDFKTKRISRLAKLDKPSFFGLTVAPDGRTLVYSQWDRSEHDILVIRNFR